MAGTGQLGRVADYETEALIADLIERVELQGARVARLESELETVRVERDVVEAELEHATRVVERLTRELLEAEARLDGQSASLLARIRQSAPGM